MSLNLMVAVEQEDHDNIIRPMVLTRFTSGITGTAQVRENDVIDFDGLDCWIGQSRHKYATREIAPVTNVFGKFHRPLSDSEIEMLRTFGFKDLNGEITS